MWIDEKMALKKDLVQHLIYKEMEILDLGPDNEVYIPSTNEDGLMKWCKVSRVVRHDPGLKLFKIRTLSGREVIVTESNSLLIHRDNKFIPVNTEEVKIGDFVPTTMSLLNTITKDTFLLIEGHKFHFTKQNGIKFGMFLGYHDHNPDPLQDSYIFDFLDSYEKEEFLEPYNFFAEGYIEKFEEMHGFTHI